MFPDTLVKLAIFVLAGLSVGAVMWALFYNRVSGGAARERLAKVADQQPVATRRREAAARADGDKRRKQIEQSVKEMEERTRKAASAATLQHRIQQAGLSWSRRTFIVFSVLCGLAGFGVAQVMAKILLVSIALGFAAAFGLPRWFLAFRRKRRLTAFMKEFPNAVDVIVRGVKAGLPLGDCLRICAQESQEPVRAEFRTIVEQQAVGITIADAVEKLYERVPVSEANFFAIVVAVQQRSGGNLSEVLGNLSKVLRDRKKMKMKIIALSQEAKASAAIIASLPLIVMGLVYMSSPDYISMLWTTSPGQLMMMGCGVWMFLGVLVMRKMINFDF